mgnify:CR=1 FL=1
MKLILQTQQSGRLFQSLPLFFLHELWYNNINKSTQPLEEAHYGGYLKGYGLCRERHCLWAVPLLIFCLIRTSFVEKLALRIKT